MTRERNLLVTGGTGFIGSHFLFRLMQSGSHAVALVRGKSAPLARERLLRAIGTAAASYREPFDRDHDSRGLRVEPGDIAAPLCGVAASTCDALAGTIDEVWHIAASLQFDARSDGNVREQNVGGTRNAIALAKRLGARRFVYVSTAYVAGRQVGVIPEGPAAEGIAYNNAYEASKAEAERAVRADCEACGLDYRVLRPSIVIGPSTTKSTGGSTTGLYGFLRELHKSREYLNREGLQITVRADPATPINLISVDAVVAEMLRLHREGFGDRTYFHLVNPHPPTAKQLMKLICELVGINDVLLHPSHEASSPIERLLARRFEFYRSYFLDPKQFACSYKPVATVTTGDMDLYMREALREKEGNGIDSVLERFPFRTRDGMQLTAFKGGRRGSPLVVLVNAYGMSGDFMAPLAARLSEHHEVLTWETRGVPGLSGELTRQNATPDAHVHDLLDLLAAHGASGPVHVIGWCSGALIAHRFARLHRQQVASLCLLNPAYSSAGLPLTDFQRSVRELMPRISRGIEYARMYHAITYGSGDARGDAAESGRLNRLLDGVDPRLIPMTSLPFQTPESLFRYALMLDELLKEGEERWVGQIRCPCMIVAGRKDKVAHCEGSLQMARQYAGAELVIMEDGDHYSLYFDGDLAAKVNAFVSAAASRQSVAAVSSQV